MPRTPTNATSASTPAEHGLEARPADATDNNNLSNEGRAPSPTYAQVVSRPPSPRRSGSATSETTAVHKAPAPPPPTPLATESPAEAPFTQRGAAASDDEDLGWTTVKAPLKSKKSKPKKGKGKAKATVPVQQQDTQAPGLTMTPNASPKSSEPRKRRRTDYGDEGLTADKRQDAPSPAQIDSQSANEFPNEEVGMDVDSEADLRNHDFGRPNFFTRNESTGWSTPPSSRAGDFEPGPSVRPLKGHKRSNARHDLRSFIVDRPINATHGSSSPAAQSRTPTQQRSSHARTPTPAAPPRIPGKFVKKRGAAKSPTQSSLRARQTSSDEEMLPTSDAPVQSDASTHDARPREPAIRHGRGRYSLYAVGNPPVQRTPSPELSPYDVLLADSDITIPPEGLLKETQGDRMDWKKKGLCLKQAKAWNDLGRGRPLIVVQFGELGAEEAGMNERAVFLVALLSRLSERNDVQVNPGHGPLEEGRYEDNKDAPPNKEPYWIAIENLPDDWCIALARAAWLRAGKYVLNFTLWRHDPPTLCAQFRSVFRFKAQSKEEYEAIVRRELLNSELMTLTLNLLEGDIERGGKWRRALLDDAFGAILDSVDVEVHNSRITSHTSEDIAFIHISSPTADWQEWITFRDAVQAHKFGSSAAGHPIPFLGRVFCGFCHSLGHPTGRCPAKLFFFPKQSLPQKQQPTQSSSAGRGGYQGGRGNGNGRGRGGRGGKMRGY
ncbi:hypothetical protein EVJ58_g6520 [Rhodofomes roseus]|uniref:Uncharacterized protein n=1 Tax=Rhodofomes roseus TaxID=34475 RepID=A0A4Y9Y8N9_9APHY|nr:hypothetical protein EVJ58_g6520 [Rhodofomes roseus]